MKVRRIILFALIISGCSMGGKEFRPAETVNQEPKRSTIDENIERAMLDPEAVNAFELQAVEKFRDLLDYIKVSKSAELDQILRDEASKAVDQLFVAESDSKTIALTDKEKSVTVDELMTDLSSIKEIIFATPFRPLRSDVFAGEINYLPLDSIARKKILVYLIRIEKSFGSEKHYVWEIKFGEIK